MCLLGPERFFSVVRNTIYTYALSGRAKIKTGSGKVDRNGRAAGIYHDWGPRNNKAVYSHRLIPSGITRALASLQGAQVLPVLRDVLRREESALVRECAVGCCTVIEPRTPETGDILILALRDSNDEVRRIAVKTLRRGFGRQFGYDPTAEPLEREGAVRKWRDWYERNKARLKWDPKTRRFEPVEGEDQPGA